MSTLLDPADHQPAPETVTAPVPTLHPAEPAVAAAPEPAETPTEEPRYVPLAALHEERTEKKALKAELEQLRAKASEVETLKQQIEALSQRIPQPKADPVPVAPLLADDQADALAKTLQLFDAQGVPDREAARRAAGIMAAMAKQQATEAVAPIVALSAAERAQQYRQRAEQVKDADGRGVDPVLLKKMWDVVPPELIGANPQVPAILTYAAAGYERLHGKKMPAAPEQLPVVTERAGGRADTTHSLSDFELGFVQRSGIKAEDYTKRIKGYKPGQPFVLE